MKKYFITLTILLICGNAFGQIEKEPIVAEKTSDYWVYVRLEDRSGVTKEDDAGRSKAGDVVAVLPVSPQHIPSETEKKSYMIYKASLTETKRQEMLEPWVEETGIDEEKNPIFKTIAYRKNKLDTSKLGVVLKKGLVTEKIDTSKINISIKTSDDLLRYEIKRYISLASRPIKKAYKIVSNYFIPKTYAFSTTSCGDFDTEDREQVCTINKTGEDYNTLTLWEDAMDGDLTVDKQIRTAECYDDDGALDDGFTIDGSTTNDTYYMKVTVPVGERHDGTAGTGFVINPSKPWRVPIVVNDPYTVIEWLEITSYGGSGYNISAIFSQADSDNSTYRFNLIHDEVAGNNGMGIRTNGAAGGRSIYNNIIYNTGAYGINGAAGYGGVSNAYNNTVYGCENGFSGRYNELVMKNNISYNNTTDFKYTSSSDDYNFSKDNTAAGANSIHGDTDGATPDFVSVTGGSEDFHLQSTSDAIDAGVDLSGTFILDIDAVARSGTWDIGADEYVASRNRLMIIQ